MVEGKILKVCSTKDKELCSNKHDSYLNLSEERIEEHIWCSFVILKVVCVLTSIVKRRRGRRPPPHKGVPKIRQREKRTKATDRTTDITITDPNPPVYTHTQDGSAECISGQVKGGRTKEPEDCSWLGDRSPRMIVRRAWQCDCGSGSGAGRRAG